MYNAFDPATWKFTQRAIVEQLLSDKCTSDGSTRYSIAFYSATMQYFSKWLVNMPELIELCTSAPQTIMQHYADVNWFEVYMYINAVYTYSSEVAKLLDTISAVSQDNLCIFSKSSRTYLKLGYGIVVSENLCLWPYIYHCAVC